MYPIVEIECIERGIKQKADVLEFSQRALRVVVQGSELAIDLRHEGRVYVGRQAGLEFVCTATYSEIEAQSSGR